MIEMLAQAGAVCMLSKPEYKGKIALFAGIDKAKFRKQVVPGDVLDLEVKDNWSLFFVEDRGINFVGYVFKHNLIRLRRSIVKTLRKISLKIKQRVNKGMLINYHLYCGINSMVGWLKHCDSGGLMLKYVVIIWDHVVAYHDQVIMKKRRKLACS